MFGYVMSDDKSSPSAAAAMTTVAAMAALTAVVRGAEMTGGGLVALGRSGRLRAAGGRYSGAS